MCFLAVYYTCHGKNKTYLSSIVLSNKFIRVGETGEKMLRIFNLSKRYKNLVGVFFEKKHAHTKKLSNLHFSLCTHSEGVVAVCFPSKED